MKLGTALFTPIVQQQGVLQRNVLRVTLFAVANNAIASSLLDGLANSIYVDDLVV